MTNYGASMTFTAEELGIPLRACDLRPGDVFRLTDTGCTCLLRCIRRRATGGTTIGVEVIARCGFCVSSGGDVDWLFSHELVAKDEFLQLLEDSFA